MFSQSQTEAKLDAEILSALSKLDDLDPKSEEYGVIVERVSKLHKLKTEEKSRQISPDTMLIVAANIFGILWITNYERANVITSKSLGFVMKPR
jgi:hypothetical protein